MKLLLDTCSFLWLISDDPALSPAARTLFAAAQNQVFLSAASVWEILIKHRLGRLPLPAPAERFVVQQRQAHGIEPLPIMEDAVMHLHKLPDHHKDPFDRILICQAISQGMTLLTPDDAIARYPVPVVW